MDQAQEPTNDATSLCDLSPDHVDPLRSTLARILETQRARRTFAQIIDGLPIKDDSRRSRPKTHPLVDEKLDVCPEAYEVLDTFQDNFSLDMLQFNTEKAQAYQNTAVGSDGFAKHLLEMTAIGLHNIGANLFTRADGGLHQYKLQPGDSSSRHEDFGDLLFYHCFYYKWKRYPQGAADCAGYWVEAKILGGVVVFDRGESNLEFGEVYLHPLHPFKLFSLLPSQLQAFVDFGTNPQQEASRPPLPMWPKLGAERIHHDLMDRRNIFRYQYERQPISPDYKGVPGFRCVQWMDDDLEHLASFRDAMNRGILPPPYHMPAAWFAPLDRQDGDQSPPPSSPPRE